MFMTANEIMRNIRNIFKLSFKEAVIHEILRVNKVVSSTCPTWILIIAESQRLTEFNQSKTGWWKILKLCVMSRYQHVPAMELGKKG